MASELASMYVSITPNMSGFRTSVLKELKGVDSDAAGAGSSSGGAFSGAFGRAISGIGSALATALKVGTGAALAGVAAAGTVGIKTAAQLETAQIGFTTMLGSGEKAAAFLKDLTNFAATTPFELPGLQKSASQLVAIGIDTEKVIPIMTTLGNITSGMGTGSEGIQRAVVAIQQMNAAQRITAEDLNQLRDAGVPVFELLSKATGKSTQQIAAMAQAGKLGKTELDALMSTLESGVGLERFNGLMEKQSQSLAGLASTAKDTFQIGMAGAIEPLIPLLKDGLGGAIDWMGTTLFPAVTFGLQETIGSVTAFASAWKANDGDITSSGMPGFFERLGYWGRQAFDGIREVLAPLRPVFDAVVQQFERLSPVFGPLIPQIVSVVSAFNPFSLILKALEPVLPSIIGAFGDLGVIIGGALSTVLPPVVETIGKLAGLMAGVFAAIMPTIIGLVGTLVGVFAQVAPVVMRIVDAVAPLIAQLVTALVPVFADLITSVLPGIVNAILPLVNILIDVLVPIIQNVVVPIITVAFTVIAEIIKVAIGIVTVIITALVWYFQNVLGPVFTWLYENIVKPVWDAISKVITDVWNWLDENVFKPWSIIFAYLGQVLSDFWNNTVKPTWEAIQKAIGDVWNWLVLNVWDPMSKAYLDLGTAINDFWKNVVEPVWKGIQDAIGGAWNWIRDNVFNPLSDFIQKTIPAAFEAGKDAIGKAWEMIRDIVKAPVKFVIETIINDGIIGAINTVRGWFQLDPLPRVAMPDGFAAGGYTGDGGKYQPAGIVHAGEFVLTKEQTAAAGVGNLYALAAHLNGYAGGGLVSPLAQFVISQGFSGINGHNGIDMAAPQGTTIHAAGPGRVSFAGWSGYGGGNETHIDHPNGLQTWYAHQSGFTVGLGSMVDQGQPIGFVGSTGLSSGPHLHYMVLDGGWPNVLDPTPYLTGGGAPGSGQGGGFFNPLAGLLDGFLDSVKSAFPQAGPILDIAIGAVKNVFDSAMKGLTDLIMGSTDKKGPQGRTGGAPVTVYDGGGWLPSMAEPMLVQHRTRKPDAVLTNERFRDFHDIAEGVRNGGTGGVSPEQIREALDGMTIDLTGTDVMANHMAAKLRLARSRRV